MKKFLLLGLVVVFMSGCGVQTNLKHLKSNIIGLDRVVTLYSATGEVLKTWNGRYKVEDNGGSISFIHNGKTVKLSGTYTVEEI